MTMGVFAIRISPLWGLLLRIVGITPETAFVELGERRLDVTFGSYRRSIDLSAIDGAETMKWPWHGGVGIRMGRGLFALIGDTGDAVTVRFKSPQSFTYLVTVNATRAAFSLVDGEGFVRALNARLHGE